MKNTSATACLSHELLRFVRDHRPTEAQLVERIGFDFHVLRKERVIVPDGDRWVLNLLHLSSDGQRFTWANRVFRLDTDETLILRPS